MLQSFKSKQCCLCCLPPALFAKFTCASAWSIHAAFATWPIYFSKNKFYIILDEYFKWKIFQLISKVKCRYIFEESLYGLKENCLKTHGDGTHTQCIAVLVFILSHIFNFGRQYYIVCSLDGPTMCKQSTNCANLLYLHQKRIHVKYFTHFDWLFCFDLFTDNR